MDSSSFFKELLDTRNIAAFKIQCRWKSYRLNKYRKSELEYYKQQLKIYSTSLTYNSKYTSDTDRVKFLFDHYKVDYTTIDAVYQKDEWEKIKLKDKKFPIVFAYGRILGSYDEIQELEDHGHLESILKGEFLRKCLYCHMPREKPEKKVCSYCWKHFEYFVKNDLIEE